MPQSKRIAVVGAGIAGLSAAYELKKAGFEVVVFERNSYPGGRMSTRDSGGLPFDMGADFLINGWYSQLSLYAEELGVRWQVSEPGGRHRIVRDSIPYYVDIVGPKEVLRFKLLSFRARIAFLLFLFRVKFFSGKLDFFDLSSNPCDLDTKSAAEYLRTHVHTEVLDYIGDPFTSIMQFHRADEIGTSALFSLLQAMMDTSRGFRVAYTPGGMGMIPRALAAHVGVRYMVDVVSISSRGQRVEVVHGTGTELYDAVVLATTGTVAQKILKNAPGTLRDMFRALRYAPTVTLSYLIPHDLFTDNAHLTYVPYVENQVLSGYDNTIRKDPAAQLDGRSVLNVYLHEEAAQKYSTLGDAELFSLVKSELLKVCPEARARTGEVVPHDVERWKDAMPKLISLSRHLP